MNLDLLWHLRGTVVLAETTTNEAVLRRLERLLKAQRKTVVERGTTHVAFASPLWGDLFASNWLSMIIYDRGRFWIEPGSKLRYELRSLHGFIFCLLGAGIFFCFGFAFTGLPEGLKLAAMAFGWLYGGNILLALLRVPSAIKKAVRSG